MMAHMPNTAFRRATSGDASLLRSLAQRCPPLDVHTHYTYWTITEYFGDLCAVAEVDGTPVGFATAVLRGDRGLLWQVGVLPAYRTQGVGSALLTLVAARLEEHGVRRLEVSIAPDNVASHATLFRLAEDRGVEVVHQGDVDLHDLADPSFTEFEHRYVITL